MLNQWLAPMVMTSALAENEYSSGGGQTAVKVGVGGGGEWGGGSVIYGIPFGSWGKISTGTLPCLLLQLQYSFILFYFTLFFFI